MLIIFNSSYTDSDST